MASPPKPWEQGGGQISTSTMASTAASTATAKPSMSTAAAPALPARPDSLSTTANQNASNYSAYNANRYGGSPYGYGAGGYNSYSSPYNRMGGGYGYGGMGGMYGGGMYGNSMYGGGMSLPGNPNNPNSLTQSFGNSTQATFQMIESIVGAFGGFAQMLESTYMATHSSFFAMVSVAEQFGNLKQTLGSVLGIFALMRWFKAAIAKLTGRPPPASPKELTPANFASFTGGPDAQGATPRPSKKPFIFFIVAVFGLPYLMGKLIRALARSQEEEERRRIEANPLGDGQTLDPSKLEFCRVQFDFTPDNNANGVQGVDLAVKKGDLVAVLSKSDPMGNPSEWWRCRARDGRQGYLPSPYLEAIQRRQQPAQITSRSPQTSPVGSRTQTMTSSVGSRTATMTPKAPEKAPPALSGKAADISVESFQKNHFNS